MTTERRWHCRRTRLEEVAHAFGTRHNISVCGLIRWDHRMFFEDKSRRRCKACSKRLEQARMKEEGHG
jgi:hypothetical protein